MVLFSTLLRGNTMTKLLLILMMVGVWSGCGGDSPTGDEKRDLLTWTTNYDDGTVKEEYQYYHHPENNRKMNHGWYNSYYPNGEYHEVGTYQDNVRDGEWTYFTDEGTETTGIYKDGNRDSGEFWLYVRWDESDRTFHETDEIPNRLDIHAFNGTFTYSNGILDGEATLWWDWRGSPDTGRPPPPHYRKV